MKLIYIFCSIIILSGQLLFAQAPNSEIHLFSIEKKGGKYTFSGGANISNNAGYDNQPSFALDSKSIFFTTNRRENNFDIYKYSLTDKKISPVVTSVDNEYTGKQLDENTVTFVREGKDQTMTVFKMNRQTKKESLAFKIKDPIAYYAFNGNGDALVWVRYAFFMKYVNSGKNINRYVTNYGQPSVPHLIPKTNNFSFMQRHPDDSLWIKEFNPTNQAVRPIITSKDGKKDYAWMPDGSLLIGSKNKLYSFNEKTDKTWKKVADLTSFGIKEVTRIAVSPDGKHLALVDNK